jgi:hypothetical protein
LNFVFGHELKNFKVIGAKEKPLLRLFFAAKRFQLWKSSP